jgi:toluene monooxygenase system protein E
MAMVRRREPPKTWSLLGDVRRKPSEYEVVTAKLHYHYRRQPAPFELDPNTPINTWYIRYREGSPLQADTWEGFRDPHQLTYQVYVQRQAERETYLENLVDEFERRNHDARLQTDWVRVLDRLYLPARFPMHALQMSALYEAQMAPSSFITNAAYFQAADEQRRIQWLAYRAKSLSLEHDAELASSAYTRRRWEEDAVWQPLRETVEKMLIAYDWGEAFVALNLIVKPVFDAVFNVQLAELARSHEDALLALMLDDFALDSQRSCDWTVALVQYAVAQRPANAGLLKQWVDQWKPLAYRGMEGVVEVFGQAPSPLEPRVVSAKVRAAHHAFLAQCGLNADQQAFVSAQNLDGYAVQDQEVTPMATELQKSGIDVIGDMVAWGAHFCLFYETKDDLLDALISYCKSGLENEEYCLWVVTEPLTIEEATAALKQAVPDFDSYLADDRVEIVSANDFFLQGGAFDRKRVAEAMVAKLAGLSARGYAGVRLTGDTSWVTKKDWIPFCELEDGINQVIGNQRLAVLCTYSLAACGAYEILDAVRTHQFALARREGNWVVIETAALKQAKAEIKRLNEELEQRVVERTSELMKASEALREAQAELARVTRLTAMGELTGSIGHELNQPLAGAVANGDACLAWLSSEPPNLDEARAAAGRMIEAVTLTSDIVRRIRDLFKKAAPERVRVNINEVIEATFGLIRSEALRNNVSFKRELGPQLPFVLGDRVQLQQVVLNLMMNGIEAMRSVDDRIRQLRIRSATQDPNQVLVTVADSGSGIDPQIIRRVFEPFYTRKPKGIGMGLAISRSIIEAHGGRLWAEPKTGQGATLQFTLPADI